MSTLKKAVFLTYSFTGNTRYIAERIGMHLQSDCDCEITHIDAIAICKALRLGEIYEGDPRQSNDLEPVDVKILDELKLALATAEIFGVGAFAWASNAGPGFMKLFDEGYLPSSLFKNVKYFCVYASYGNLPPQIPEVFANAVKRKNEHLKFLGFVTVRCPENGVPNQPFKPEYDAMSPKELEKLEYFARTVAKLVLSDRKNAGHTDTDYNRSNKDKDKGTSVSFPPVPSPPLVSLAPLQKSLRRLNAHPVLNRERCVKCGLCVRACPYNVISIRQTATAAAAATQGRLGSSSSSSGDGGGGGEEKEKEKEKGFDPRKQRTCNQAGDIEDGYPVWVDAYERDWGTQGAGAGGGGVSVLVSANGNGDGNGNGKVSQCWHCGRCFNTCPQEAIEIPKNDTPARTRYRGPVFLSSPQSSSPSLCSSVSSSSSLSSASSCSSSSSHSLSTPFSSTSLSLSASPSPTPPSASPSPTPPSAYTVFLPTTRLRADAVVQTNPSHAIMLPRMFDLRTRTIRRMYWALLGVAAVGAAGAVWRWVL